MHALLAGLSAPSKKAFKKRGRGRHRMLFIIQPDDR